MPELRNFSNEYIYEPWKAPLDAQEKAGCIIGLDYPVPIVNHELAFGENLDKLRKFFNSEKRELFTKFLTDKTVLKPENSKEYRLYTFANFLESEFDI